MGDDTAPYLALAASLIFLAASAHYLVAVIDRPAPSKRRPTRPGPLHANSNEAPVPDLVPPAAARRFDLTALAIAIAGPGSILAAAAGAAICARTLGWL